MLTSLTGPPIVYVLGGVGSRLLVVVMVMVLGVAVVTVIHS